MSSHVSCIIIEIGCHRISLRLGGGEEVVHVNVTVESWGVMLWKASQQCAESDQSDAAFAEISIRRRQLIEDIWLAAR